MIFLGVDCGTQSTKTIAIDWDSGEVLAAASLAYDFVPGLPVGAAEQNPSDWVSALDATVSQVLLAIGHRRDEVRGIGVSGQQHGLVVLDAAGAVIRPAKLWCDLSTQAQCAEITAHFGGAPAVIERVGNSMRPGYTAPKILWLRQNEPEHWARTSTVLLPHDYLNFWLTGALRMEYGDASGTALLDVKSRQWSADMVSFIAPDLADKLPPLGSSRPAHGFLRPDLAQRWSLAGEVVVSAGGGDNMMAAIGTGNVDSGVVTASLGTSGTLFATSAQPIIDPIGEVAGFCDSTDQWLPLVCTMNVTLVTEHIRKMFRWSYAELEAAIVSVPVGSDGLLLLPYLTGERTPDLPSGTGVFQGMNLANFTPAYMARAAMEGATLGLGYGLQRLRELGLQPSEIRLTGGGSNSAVWRQICADVFDVPTVCLANDQGAAMGAAIQAGWTWAQGQGEAAILPDLCARLVPTNDATRCTPQSAAIYTEALSRSRSILSGLQSVHLL